MFTTDGEQVYFYEDYQPDVDVYYCIYEYLYEVVTENSVGTDETTVTEYVGTTNLLGSSNNGFKLSMLTDVFTVDGDQVYSYENGQTGKSGYCLMSQMYYEVEAVKRQKQFAWGTRSNGNFGLMWKDVTR